MHSVMHEVHLPLTVHLSKYPVPYQLRVPTDNSRFDGMTIYRWSFKIAYIFYS